MSNNYQEYYCFQAGSGLPGFQGLRYQKGYGFFGRLLRGTILPFLKTAGKKAAKEGIGLAEDLMAGQKIKTAAKNRGKSLAKQVARDAIELAKSKIASQQEGRGIIGRVNHIKRQRKRTVKRKKGTVKRRRSKKKPTKKRKKKATKSRQKKAKKSKKRKRKTPKKAIFDW